ncbi:thioesterase family protein [Sphingomonas flavalba]|uniref:thioesterase family protein n=1 Tax=Sphingomonas flavalba TaxID=2559804 RepID=UPI0039DF886D
MADLSETIAAMAERNGTYHAAPGADWRQGQTLYGGLSAALAVHAAERAFPGLPPLRSAQFAFVGPAAGALAYRPAMARRGKSSAFVTVAADGEAGPATQALLCYGQARDSACRCHEVPMPLVAGPEGGVPFFTRPGVPGFSGHFDAMLVEGRPPVSGAERPFLRVWVRHHDPGPPDGALALIALGDALPPPALSLFSAFVPISTMTWSVELPPNPPMPGDDWYLFESRGEVIGDGYAIQDMKLWHADGRLALVGRQTVALYG